MSVIQAEFQTGPFRITFTYEDGSSKTVNLEPAIDEEEDILSTWPMEERLAYCIALMHWKVDVFAQELAAGNTGKAYCQAYNELMHTASLVHGLGHAWALNEKGEKSSHTGHWVQLNRFQAGNN
jgi:hypothetical protein